MISVRLDQHSALPVYEQITDQIRQLIATSQLKPNDHLPTIRELARSLGVNQNTVMKAYRILEQEQVIVSRRGGGTTVAAEVTEPAIRNIRRNRLSDIISSQILKLLSLNYNPEEIEATFHLHLTRWREEKQALIKASEQEHKEVKDNNIIHIVGSHDLALNILVDLLRQRSGIIIELTPAGSLGGLIALQEERANLAGIHLLDEETGEYNYPYVKRILPGRKVAVVNLVYRTQGLILFSGNPKQIKGFQDLRRADIVFVNRQKGSGTRVLLDLQLRKHGILASEINGYGQELETHLAIASSIDKEEVDVGLGIKAAGDSYGLDFIPLFQERYDLIMTMNNYQSQLMTPLLAMVASEDFKEVVDQVGGYDCSQTGKTTFIE